MQPHEPKVSFTGPFAGLCESFVSYKNALGYKYHSEAKMLRFFDSFCGQLNNVGEIPTKELMDAFFEANPQHTLKTKSNFLCTMRQFGQYLNNARGCDAYIPPPSKRVKSSFTPHIYTSGEIQKLFAAVDGLKRNMNTPYMHLVLPVLMRMLYCSGLRISEALGLLKADVDLKNGILTVRGAKFDKDRYIPMSGSMTNVCRDYAASEQISESRSGYFFPAPDNGRISARTISMRFRDMLQKSGIGYGGRGVGPRLHDLRHTFAVGCLRKFVSEGVDVLTALPVLSAYMGHETVLSTQRYLRLTADVFPEIAGLMGKVYAGLFPEVNAYETD
jgi:integrase